MSVRAALVKLAKHKIFSVDKLQDTKDKARQGNVDMKSFLRSTFFLSSQRQEWQDHDVISSTSVTRWEQPSPPPGLWLSAGQSSVMLLFANHLIACTAKKNIGIPPPPARSMHKCPHHIRRNVSETWSERKDPPARSDNCTVMHKLQAITTYTVSQYNITFIWL